MILKHHAPLVLAALATGWMTAGVAIPAMAQDRNTAIVTGGAPVNQGPHSLGDPMASGATTTGPTAPRDYYNQGPHNFSDPTASGHVATGPTSATDGVNRGPHTF